MLDRGDMNNKLKVNKSDLNTAHKLGMALSAHRKLTSIWHEFDLIVDEKGKASIQEAIYPIESLLSELVNSPNA